MLEAGFQNKEFREQIFFQPALKHFPGDALGVLYQGQGVPAGRERLREGDHPGDPDEQTILLNGLTATYPGVAKPKMGFATAEEPSHFPSHLGSFAALAVGHRPAIGHPGSRAFFPAVADSFDLLSQIGRGHHVPGLALRKRLGIRFAQRSRILECFQGSGGGQGGIEVPPF